jgi:hypothetical protein
LPSCNATILKSFARENTANFLKLKYELKKASLSLTDTNAAQSVKVSTEPKKSIKPKFIKGNHKTRRRFLLKRNNGDVSYGIALYLPSEGE